MSPDTPHILLVNPWIHDFAAYDFWAKPMGLLTLAAILRQSGCRVSYIDCLDRFHPRADPTDPGSRRGRGPYRKTPIAAPPGLEDVPRTFSRYGISPGWLQEDLRKIPRPDLVLVTSMMTYWYPGVKETVANLRTGLPGVPVILGGVYATLCPEHARDVIDADQVVSGQSVASICDLVGEYLGISLTSPVDPQDPDTYPYPAFDLQSTISCIPLLTTIGCPFDCTYCAAKFLAPGWMRRSPEGVLEEIQFWHRGHGVSDFVFYDDALLVDAPRHAVPLMEAVVRKGLDLRFHTPNAVHIREINRDTARLMFTAGFHNLRLGLDTVPFDSGDARDAKATTAQFEKAAGWLRQAGFKRDQVGAYLLFGLPGQTLSEFTQSIQMVHRCGITPIPAYYTPIPHTDLWNSAVTASRYDLNRDPVFTNNAVFPCREEPFSWQTLHDIREVTACSGRTER